ncbi:MAG: DUF4198 domain-containing protein [Verrucomicrobia bacterium]|nr:DUF4198 domain-containing protein [Verrucomicrobiota bacterium]
MFPRPRLAALALFGLLLPAVGAHDTYLVPSTFDPTPNTPLHFDLTSGMTFPKLDVAVKPERVQTAKLRLGATTIDLSPAAAPQSMRFDATLATAGLATVGVTLKPRTLEMEMSKVGHYLDEISATPDIRKRARKQKRWKESYVKHSKTFVEATADPADRSWSQPLGLGLEIVPERSPLSLEPGEEFPVRVLRQGQPLAGFALNLVVAGQTRGITRRTDANGRATFRIRQQGLHLLRGTDLRPASGEVDWESDFTTLTLRVK